MVRGAIFDVDGTLVDSNYQHALAWYRAFRDGGIVRALITKRSLGRGLLLPARAWYHRQEAVTSRFVIVRLGLLRVRVNTLLEAISRPDSKCEENLLRTLRGPLLRNIP